VSIVYAKGLVGVIYVGRRMYAMECMWIDGNLNWPHLFEKQNQSCEYELSFISRFI